MSDSYYQPAEDLARESIAERFCATDDYREAFVEWATGQIEDVVHERGKGAVATGDPWFVVMEDHFQNSTAHRHALTRHTDNELQSIAEEAAERHYGGE